MAVSACLLKLIAVYDVYPSLRQFNECYVIEHYSENSSIRLLFRKECQISNGVMGP